MTETLLPTNHLNLTDTAFLANTGPVRILKTNRSLAKFIFLGIVTLGIYPIVVMYESTESLNLIAQRDGRKTMNYLLTVLLLTPITAGIYSMIWSHGIANRIGDESSRRGFGRMVSASDFWIWNILGTLIIVGPFIYLHKFLKAMNSISASYNQVGA